MQLSEDQRSPALEEQVREWWQDSHLHWVFAYGPQYYGRLWTTLYRLAVLTLLVVIAIRL